MQDTLSNYMNRNLKDIISNISVVQGTAKDSGNIYYAIELTFINGFVKRLFLRSDEQFAWINAIELLDSSKQIDTL